MVLRKILHLWHAWEKVNEELVRLLIPDPAKMKSSTERDEGP